MLWLLFVSWSEIYPHVEQEILLTVREVGLIFSQLRLHLGMSQKTEWALQQGIASMETGITVPQGAKRTEPSLLHKGRMNCIRQVSSGTGQLTGFCGDHFLSGHQDWLMVLFQQRLLV